MQTAFVLGGGGILGAHEVGMLRALSEAGIRPDVVVGTSVGAINGALVAADPAGAAAGGSRLGRLRALRLLSFALIWLVAETAALFMCLALWITSGFGGRLRTEPYQSRHYALMERYLGRLYGAAVSTLGLRIEVHEPELTAGEQAARLARPVIVLSRHAGPGDSLLLVHHLLTVYHRRPRIVMKAALQLDPGLDVITNRVPNVFIRPQRTGEKIYTEQISRLAAGLGQDGALVIFPEGGNWTPGRWRRGIQRLERQGRADLAEHSAARPHPDGRDPRVAGRGTSGPGWAAPGWRAGISGPAEPAQAAACGSPSW